MEKHIKEVVYDEQISPLMKQIIQICQDNDINFFADFCIGENQTDYCSSHSARSDGTFSKYNLLNMLSQCAEAGGMNMDKFLLAVKKNYPRNTSSFFMDKIFENGDWRSQKDNTKTE